MLGFSVYLCHLLFYYHVVRIIKKEKNPETVREEELEGDTKTYFETTYSDLSAYVDKNVSEIWAAVGNASKDEENNILYVQDQKGNRYEATFKLDGTMIATIEMV